MKRAMFSTALCAVLVGCSATPTDSGGLEGRIQALESDVSDLRADMNRLKSAPPAQAAGRAPAPSSVTVSVEDSFRRTLDAPLALVEFSDFQ